jgi:hypothetical protein
MNVSRDRTTGDLLVLMIAGTVCVVVVGLATALIIVAFTRPEQDTAGAASAVGDVVNTLIGLLAGFLAGRTDTLIKKNGNGNQSTGSSP